MRQAAESPGRQTCVSEERGAARLWGAQGILTDGPQTQASKGPHRKERGEYSVGENT